MFIKIERDKVIESFEKARKLLDEVGFQLSKSEAGHIKESIKTKSIPTPKLLIKNHKKAKQKRRISNKASNTSNKLHSYLCESWISWPKSNSQQSSGELLKIHDNSSITSEGMLGKVRTEKRKSNNSIN